MQRSGVIGTGLIGTVHIRAVRAAGGRVVAIAGENVAEAEKSALELGVPAAMNPDALIESDDVDIVHICSPNSTHYEYALKAIENGKAVICEKPLSLTLLEARTLQQAAEAAKVVNVVPFVYRYYPAVREIRARIEEDNELAWLVRGAYLQDWLLEQSDYNWRVNEGTSRAFGDIGVHWCDLLEFTTGERIERIMAATSRLHEERLDDGKPVKVATEDAVNFLVEMSGGAMGAASLSQATAGKKNELSLSIDTALHSYHFNQESPDRVSIGGRKQNIVVMKGYETTDFPAVAKYVSVPSGHPQGFLDCFINLMRDVYSAMDGATVEGMPTFADGVRAAKLTERAMVSAAQEVWISVSEEEHK